ncbi:MAG: hypothetical protein RL199_78 [Pseudomonadota bacterium]|jgi:hypothetical protein
MAALHTPLRRQAVLGSLLVAAAACGVQAPPASVRVEASSAALASGAPVSIDALTGEGDWSPAFRLDVAGSPGAVRFSYALTKSSVTSAPAPTAFLDGGTLDASAGASLNLSGTALPAGLEGYAVKAWIRRVDAAGSLVGGVSSVTSSAKCDRTAPTASSARVEVVRATAVTQPAGGWAQLRFSGFSDAASGIDRYDVYVRSGATPPAACVGSGEPRVTRVSFAPSDSGKRGIAGLSEGTLFSVAVCAVDKAGNTSGPATLAAIRELSAGQLKGPVVKDAAGKASVLVLSQSERSGFARDLGGPVDAVLVPAPAGGVREGLQVCLSESGKLAAAGNPCADDDAAGWQDAWDASSDRNRSLSYHPPAPKTSGATMTVHAWLRDRTLRAVAAMPLKATILFDARAPTGEGATVTAKRGDRSATFTVAKLADPVDVANGSKASGLGEVRVAAATAAVGAPTDCRVALSGCATKASATGATVSCSGDASALANGKTYRFALCTFDQAGNAGPVLTAAAHPALTLMPSPTDAKPKGGLAAASGVGAKPAVALAGTPSADATNTATVSVRLSATGASYGTRASPMTTRVSGYCLSTSTSCPDGAWKAFAVPAVRQSAVLVTGVDLGPTDGSKMLSAWFRDEYGNVSAGSTLKVTLDRTAPTDPSGAVTAKAGTGAGAPGAFKVGLAWGAGADNLSGVAGYRVRYGIGTAPASCSAGADACATSAATKACTVAGLAGGVKVGFRVCVVDKAGNRSTGLTVEATPAGTGTDAAVEAALRTGEAAALPDATSLLAAAGAEVASLESADRAFLQGLYPAGAPGVSFRPGRNAQLVVPDGSNERCVPILVGDGGNPLAAGGGVGPGRFLAFGALPMRQATYAGDTLERALAWLATGTAGGAPPSGLKVATVHASDGDFTRSWMQTNLSWVVSDCAATGTTAAVRTAALSACLAGQQLLVVGKEAPDEVSHIVVAAVAKALAAGVPVLYQHGDWGQNRTADGLAALMGFSLPYGGNWWADDGLGLDDPAPLFERVVSYRGHPALRRLVGHFTAHDWSFDLTACGNTGCPDGHPVQEAFFDGAKLLRARLTGLDERGVALFESTGRRLTKLLVLLGDVYRRGITYYPLDKVTTPREVFLRALFADHSVSYLRPVNPAQPNLGSFSKSIPSTTPAFSDDVTVTSRPQDHFTAAGVYALPGRTLRVTRTDASDVVVKVAVNSLRWPSTKPFDVKSYTRPQFLASPWMTLVAGQTLSVTSPYGGPVQVWIQGREPATAASLTFDGVGHHPVWNGPETTASFDAALQAGIYGWAEFLTPGFQIHARRALMLETLADPLTPTPEVLAQATWDHFYRAIFDLGGWTGPGLGLAEGVAAFCDGRGWDCASPSLHGMRGMWHFNSDQATCGYGCSGNPYDAWWAFSPLGWGDAHEVGHGLQRGRFNIHGASTEASNNIYPTYTVYTWNKMHPDAWRHAEHEKSQADLVKLLSAAQREADPAAAVADVVWRGSGGTVSLGGESVTVPEVLFVRLEFFRQMALQADGLTAFGSGRGWDVWTVLHLQERLFDRTVQDDVSWLASRASLGFDGVERTVAQGFGANDYLLVALSSVTGLDERPFFDLWGVTYGVAAAAQVEAMRLPAAEKRFFLVAEDLHGEAYASSDPVDSVLIGP